MDMQTAAAFRAQQQEGGGSIRMKPLFMMRTPAPPEPGVLPIAPNFRPSGNSLHLPTLSPKFMGPVQHGCPGLPNGASLENWHQGRKVFESELTEDGEITSDALKYMQKFVADPIPHRHKLPLLDLPTKNKNIPVFSVAFSLTGEMRRFSYLESRLFYIRWYEHFCCESVEFSRLQQMLAQGYHLEILGYDAFDVPITAENMIQAYRDPSRPFGHEAVLCCLLCGLKPWKIDEGLPMYKDMFPAFLKET